MVKRDLKQLAVPQGPTGEDDGVVKLPESVRAERRLAVVADPRVLAVHVVEAQVAVQRGVGQARVERVGRVAVAGVLDGDLRRLAVQVDDAEHALGDAAGGRALVVAVHEEVQRAALLAHHAHAVAHLQAVQVLAVLVEDRSAVVHHAVAGHHPRARAHVRHRERELQLGGRVRRHADLDAARPLRHHLVQAHLEQFTGFQVS